jgi:hypothetical protein
MNDDLLLALAEHLNISDVDQVIEYHNDNYMGEAICFDDFAVDFFDEYYQHLIPRHLQSYIDYDKFADELRYDFFAIEVGTNTHIYRNN